MNDQTDGAVSFSTLLTALEISGVDNLIEERNAMTLFAPTDAALKNFLRDNGMTVDEFLVNPDTASLLLNHLADVPLSTQDLVGFSAYESVSGEFFPVQMTGDGLEVDECRVLRSDIPACGGMTVHVIDCVLVVDRERGDAVTPPSPPPPPATIPFVHSVTEDNMRMPASQVASSNGLQVLSWNRGDATNQTTSPDYVDVWFKVKNNLPYNVGFGRLQVVFFFGSPGGLPSDYVMDSYRALTEAGNDSMGRYADRSTSVVGRFLEGAAGRDDAYIAMMIEFGPRAGTLQAGRTSGEIIVQGRKLGVVPGGILGQYAPFRDSIDMDDIEAYSALGGGEVQYKVNSKMALLLDDQIVWGETPAPAPSYSVRPGWMELYYKFIPAGMQRARFSIILAANGDTPIRTPR